MADVDSHSEDWEKEAPLLSSLRGKQPYEAPEGYFDAFPSKLMDQIRNLELPAEEGDPAPVEPVEVPGPSRGWRLPRLGLAVGIAFLVGTGIWLISQYSSPPVAEELPSEEVLLADELESMSNDAILEEIDLSMISDEELMEMMGAEALAGFEVNQLGEALELDLNDLDLDAVDLNELEALDQLDLEGIEDLLDF